MRINIVTPRDRGFDSRGGYLTGPLYLYANPIQDLEAATKQYLDLALNGINIGNVRSGILPIARLPGFLGDVSNLPGSNNFNLSTTGVVPGTYTKATVDNKGRVLSASNANNADFPNVSWNKVTLDRPTTLAGFGITDGLKKTGGVLTGPLSMSTIPNKTNQLVTKGYIDTASENASAVSVGDTIRRPKSVSIPGFLLCNGAEVSKIDYLNLYAVLPNEVSTMTDAVSIDYTLYTALGNGEPWKNQYIYNGSIYFKSFIKNRDLPVKHSFAAVVATKNRVYLIGGMDETNTAQTSVYMAVLDSNGELSSWTATTSLPTMLHSAKAIVVNNKVHLIGGASNTSSAVGTTYSASINPDGTLGTWVSGNALPAPRKGFQTVLTHKYVYVLGGVNDGDVDTNTIYQATVNSDGSLSTWTTTAGTLPASIGYAQVAVIRNKVYLIGGKTGSTQLTTSYVATVDSNGVLGAFTASVNLPLALSQAEILVTNTSAYLIGGKTDSSVSNAIYKLSFSTVTGDISTGWTLEQGISLPQPVRGAQLIATRNFVHLIGGFGATTTLNTIYTSELFRGYGVNDYTRFYNGSLYKALTGVFGVEFPSSGLITQPGNGKPWQQQYEINNRMNTSMVQLQTFNTNKLPVALKDFQTLVTKNKLYILGGNTGTNAVASVYVANITASGGIDAFADVGVSKTVNLTTNTSIDIPEKTYKVTISGQGSPSTSYWVPPVDEYRWKTVAQRGPTLGPSNGNYDGLLALGGISPPTGLNQTRTAKYYTFAYESDVYYPDLGIWVTEIQPYGSGGHRPSNTQVWVIEYDLVSEVQTTPGYTAYYNGSPATITIGGVNYNFAGGTNGSAGTYSSTTVTLNGSAQRATTNIATGGYINVTYMDIQSSKTLGNYLPSELSKFQVVTTLNRAYALGGYNNTSSSNAIYTAVINNDGTLGPWTTSGITLPVGLSSFCAFTTFNALYVVGGYTTQASANVYRATINPSNGEISSFSQTNSLPEAIYEAKVAVSKRKVYLIGGRTANGSITAKVFSADITETGAINAWVEDRSLPIALTGSNVYVTRQTIFLFGGTTPLGKSGRYIYGSLDNEGLLGNWAMTSEPSDFKPSNGEIVALYNRIYHLGGEVGAVDDRIIYSNEFMTGGLNDYSMFYNGSITPLASLNFKLPDTTAKDLTDKVYTFIKY